ncbi:MAG TPA: N-acetylmuramoyl-L-alanine amidase, partial [Candidatus Krumholzibacteria bacterium]|nr:N-acetylmuramoyl-L-alanine amidase [Candidatus Krumholzibacteria bacterium]
RVVYPLPWDAPNGVYEVQVSVRNLRGNTSPVAHTRFHLDHPAALAAIDPMPARAPSNGGEVRVRARILDHRGMPVADGTAVTMTSNVAGAARMESRVSDGSVDFSLMVPPGTRRSVRVDIECAGVHFTDDIPVASGGTRAFQSVSVRDAASGAPITDASVVVGDSTVVAGSPSGTYGYVASKAAVRVTAPGYQPAPVENGKPVSMTPWFGGVLLGKRFVLDAQGGPPRSVGVGSMGLSASPVNLRVANYVASFLRAAGADVRLARTTEEVPLAEDVARMTNRFRADRYIEIRHPGGTRDSTASVHCFYFPGSANGKKMAAVISGVVAGRLAVSERGPDETVTYPLQQTACPAIVVAFPSIAGAAEEMRLAQAWYLREQAYALFMGILAMADAPADGSLTIDVTAADRRDWMVTLDDTWTLSSNDAGRVVFEHVAPGSHEVRIRRGGVSQVRTIATTAAQPAASLPISVTP